MASRKTLEQALKNPNVRKFLDLLAYTEGTTGNGYHTAFGGGRLSSLVDHPRYLKSFRQTNGKTNKTSAAGRYQFLRSTWDGLARQYGFKDFGPHNQDLGAVALLAQNGALPYVLKGDWGKAVSKAGGTWASLPSSPHPQPTKSWRKVSDFLGGKTSIPNSSKSGGQSRQRPLLFIGDSIAHGYKNHVKGQGVTREGASPAEILSQIQRLAKTNPSALRGANVVLSGGLSNNYSDIDSIERQIQILQSKGANVQLLGVSNQYNIKGGNGKAMNNQLAQLAKKYGVAFSGGFNAGNDRVHPASHAGLKLQLPTDGYAAQSAPPPDPRLSMTAPELIKSLRQDNKGISDNELFVNLANGNGRAAQEIGYLLDNGHDPNEIARQLGLNISITGQSAQAQEPEYASLLDLGLSEEDINILGFNEPDGELDAALSAEQTTEQPQTGLQSSPQPEMLESEQPQQGGLYQSIIAELPKLQEQGLSSYQALYSLAQRDDEIGQSIRGAFKDGMNSEQMFNYFGVNDIWQSQNEQSKSTLQNVDQPASQIGLLSVS